MNGDWEVVRRKGNFKGISSLEIYLSEWLESVELDVVLRLVQPANATRKFQEAETSYFLASTGKGFIKSVENVLVLGLGSLENNINSRYQLAFLLLMSEVINCQEIHLFDPVFSTGEKAILLDYNCKVLESFEFNQMNFLKPTIIYLPHFPSSVLNQLLVSNWNFISMRNMLIVGNSLSAVAEVWHNQTIVQKREATPPQAILKIIEFNLLVELPLEDSSFPIQSAFNNTSISGFPHFPEISPTLY